MEENKKTEYLIDYLNKEVDRTYWVFNQMTSAMKYFYTALWLLLWMEWTAYYKILNLDLNNIINWTIYIPGFQVKFAILIALIIVINIFYIWLLSTLKYINRLREWAMSWYVKAERCLNLELGLDSKYTDIKSYRWDRWNENYKQWYIPNINIENKAYIIIVLWLILSRFFIITISFFVIAYVTNMINIVLLLLLLLYIISLFIYRSIFNFIFNNKKKENNYKNDKIIWLIRRTKTLFSLIKSIFICKFDFIKSTFIRKNNNTKKYKTQEQIIDYFKFFLKIEILFSIMLSIILIWIYIYYKYLYLT